MSDLERLRRRLDREKLARKSAEDIAESKTRQLFANNLELVQLGEDLRQHGRELQQTLGYLTAIIDNMADGLLVIDPDGMIKLVNHAFLELFGLDKTPVTGESCTQVFDRQVQELIDGGLRLDAGSNLRLDINLPKNKTGRAVASPIFVEDQGNSLSPLNIGLVIIVRDYTREAEIDRAKTEFISNVSHELRTPLTSILGFTKIIKKKLEQTVFPALEPIGSEKLEKTVHQVNGNLDIIIAEGERLTNLINRVLDVAKMEAGKVDWNIAPIAVAPLIKRAAAATQSLFDGGDVKFVLELDEGLTDINADEDRIIQVLVNLISNASKFTERGSVVCKVSATGQEVTIRIIDTGIGIAQEDLNQVFDKFKQVGDTLTDKPKGTGLGLPICKQIVEYHGGKIWVESGLGKGSVFAFSLPLVSDTVEEATGDAKPEMNALLRQVKDQVNSTAWPQSDGRQKVLVVDDERNIRAYLRQELEDAGYDVAEADNGYDAITKAKALRPDLIVLDVMMPLLNGFDAAQVLKNDPDTMAIPIMILSIVEDLERGYRIGINRYLKKPIEPTVLLNEVAILMSPSGTRKKILLVSQDPETIETLTRTLQTNGDTDVEVCSGGQFIEKAKSILPNTIIFDTSISGYPEVEKALRKQPGLDNVSVILLGEEAGTLSGTGKIGMSV